MFAVQSCSKDSCTVTVTGSLRFSRLRSRIAIRSNDRLMAKQRAPCRMAWNCIGWTIIGEVTIIKSIRSLSAISAKSTWEIHETTMVSSHNTSVASIAQSMFLYLMHLLSLWSQHRVLSAFSKQTAEVAVEGLKDAPPHGGRDPGARAESDHGPNHHHRARSPTLVPDEVCAILRLVDWRLDLDEQSYSKRAMFSLYTSKCFNIPFPASEVADSIPK